MCLSYLCISRSAKVYSKYITTFNEAVWKVDCGGVIDVFPADTLPTTCQNMGLDCCNLFNQISQFRS